MVYKIAVLKGDGIGPEVTEAAVKVLNAVGVKFNRAFTYTYPLIGGAAIDKEGVPLPQRTIDECNAADAILLGAVGGPKWDGLTGHMRPEKGLLALRNAMNLYANVRPVVMYPQLKDASVLRPDLVQNGVNLVVVRELIGGIYFGERGYREGPHGQEAFDTERYSIAEVERIATVAFNIAMGRNKKLVSVDKANVLESSRLWRATVERVSQNYPEVEFRNMLVDACAMQLLRDPTQFDVLLCPNMFGDILSDEAAMITGSIGMLPSSALGDGTKGIFEPIHGSAPSLAGKNVANPIGTILAAAMMLASSFDMHDENLCIEKSVRAVLNKGYRTEDIYTKGMKKVSCSKMADLITWEIVHSDKSKLKSIEQHRMEEENPNFDEPEEEEKAPAEKK